MNTKKIIIIVSLGIISTVLFIVLLNNFLKDDAATVVTPVLEIQKQVATSTTPVVTIRPPFKELPVVPDGFKAYRSEFYRSQFLYLDTLVLKEYPEPVSAMTLSFKSVDAKKQFQIFIIPHGDSYITPFRISEDLPSGIMEQKVDIDFQSAKGITFVSKREGMGETKEIWFIERGFLYEVSVPLADEAWLSEILNTWEFL